MAKSKPSSEVISLGKKIVAEFSQGERCETTTRWMSHYLAELIDKAEKELDSKKKKKLNQECENTILTLWKNREHFPNNAAPLSNLKEAVSVLESLVADERGTAPWERFHRYENKSPWGKFIKNLADDFEIMTRLSLCTIATREILLKEKEWFQHETLLSKNEREFIRLLDFLLNKQPRHLGTRVVFVTSDMDKVNKKRGDKKESSRIEQVFEKMNSILNDRLEEVASLKKKVLASQNISRITHARDKKAKGKKK